MHVIRNAFFIYLKINSLYHTQKPIHPRMGFFVDSSRSTLTIWAMFHGFK